MEEGIGIRGRKGENGAQVGDIWGREAKGSNESKHFIETRKDGVFPVEGVLSEEEIKDGKVFMSSCLPVAIAHADLVHIREKRTHDRSIRSG